MAGSAHGDGGTRRRAPCREQVEAAEERLTSSCKSSRPLRESEKRLASPAASLPLELDPESALASLCPCASPPSRSNTSATAMPRRHSMPAPSPKAAAKPALKKKRASLPAQPAPPQASTSQQTLDDDDDRFAAFLDENDHEGAQEQDEQPVVEGADEEVNIDEETGGDRDEPAQKGQDEEEELDERALLAKTTLPAHLLPRSLSGGKNAKTPGLVYLSRIPPGMGPGKVKHLLSAFGEVGRIYLARADAGKGAFSLAHFPSPSLDTCLCPRALLTLQRSRRTRSTSSASATSRTTSRRAGSSTSTSASRAPLQRCSTRRPSVSSSFVCQVSPSAVDLAASISWAALRAFADDTRTRAHTGGKKSDRWHDDVWTMKYLPRFRWDQLSEQVGACPVSPPLLSRPAG